MKRIIAGVVAGFVVWVLVGTCGFYLLRAVWHDYSAVEKEMRFTLPMQLSRLAVGAICSIVGGSVAAIVAKGDTRGSWILGIILLALFIPIHYGLWAGGARRIVLSSWALAKTSMSLINRAAGPPQMWILTRAQRLAEIECRAD